MKSAQYKTFLLGIIIYLIYNKIFEILLSLNDVMLFNFHSNEWMYISGLVTAILLTNGLLYLLYSFLMKTTITNSGIRITALLLAGIVLISLGINYYLAHLDYSSVLQEEYSSTEIYRQNYEIRGVIYFLNTLLLMIVLLLGLKKRKAI